MPAFLHRLSSRLSAQSSKPSSAVAIDCLPDDLLAEILLRTLPCAPEIRSYLFKDTGRRAKRRSWLQKNMAPLNVSHVCRRWRMLALSTPLLWTTICFQGSFTKSLAAVEERAIDAFLGRSLGAALTLMICVRTPMHLLLIEPLTSPLNPLRSLRKLAAESDRWKNIHLSFTRSLLAEPIIAALSRPNPVAEYLFINTNAFRDAESKAPSFPFVPDLPNLRSITFNSHDSQNFNEWSMTVPYLRRLEINTMVPLSNLVSWATQCSQLEELILGKVFLPENMTQDVVPYELIPLVRLEILKLTFGIASLDVNSAEEILDGTLRALHIPSLKTLELRLGGTARFGSFESVAALLNATEPPVENLSLIGFNFNPGLDDAATSLQTIHLLTPKLRRLRLELDVSHQAFTNNSTKVTQIASSWTALQVLEIVCMTTAQTRAFRLPFDFDSKGLFLCSQAESMLEDISIVLADQALTDAKRVQKFLDHDPRTPSLRGAGIRLKIAMDDDR